MPTTDPLSLTLAGAALVVSIVTAFYTGRQARKASEALLLEQRLAHGNSVMHFSDRFFELLKSGQPVKQIGKPDWAYQFWSLHATEFYFFHHSMLPSFMYSLWMMDLAELYSGTDGQRVRESHVQYLKEYSFHYDKMSTFYSELFRLAQSYSDDATRNREVVSFVKRWIEQNRETSLI